MKPGCLILSAVRRTTRPLNWVAPGTSLALAFCRSGSGHSHRGKAPVLSSFRPACDGCSRHGTACLSQRIYLLNSDVSNNNGTRRC